MVKSIPPKIDIPSQDSSLKEIEYKCKEEAKYKVYQSGSHINSDFIQVYVPNEPCRKNGKTKAVIYMHGFTLCMPKFYEKHLQHLANKNDYVLFPDFQKSYYPNNPDSYLASNRINHDKL